MTENGDVYVAGKIPIQIGSEMQDAARLWKNGVAQTLTINGGTGSSANSVFVTENGDVHVAGVIYSEDSATACYWKNGTLIELSNNGSANGIAVVKKED